MVVPSSSSLQLLCFLLTSHVALGMIGCDTSEDCSIDETSYCANGECLAMGSCKLEVDCFNPENMLATDDCVGYLTCESNTCSKVCHSDNCKPDQQPVNCFANPCDDRIDPCVEAKSCVSNYCDGCNSFHFDAKGSQICVVENNATSTCTSNEDCRDETTAFLEDPPYCAAGTCLNAGICKTDSDCINPSNSYPIIECVGPIVCGDGGLCTRDCDTGSMCQEGVPEVNCFVDPCTVTACEESVACFSEYCGGCNANHFDIAGNQVCVVENNVTSTCTSNEDCRDETAKFLEDLPYCAAGTCLNAGICKTDSDCINPSNSYPLIACVGPIVCGDGGLCTRDCDTGSMCQEGVPEVNCFVDPCTVTACEESVACISEYCGGCNANHFDIAGNHIMECNDTAKSASCKSDTDCQDENHYCASGTCMQFGGCEATKDCINPSNIFASVDCTGYLECTSDKECSMVCSNEEHCCFIEACSSDDTCDEAVSCVLDNCNDINSDYDHCGLDMGMFHFDAAGNQVSCDKDDIPNLTISCKKDADCNNSTQIERSSGNHPASFCAQGVCLAAGKCEATLDCINPSNHYDRIECVGQILCGDDGTCGVQCGLACDDSGNEFVTNCLISPCKDWSSTNDEAALDGQVSCVDDYCGGCNAIRFDAAGYKMEDNGSYVDEDSEDSGAKSSMGGPIIIATLLLQVLVPMLL